MGYIFGDKAFTSLMNLVAILGPLEKVLLLVIIFGEDGRTKLGHRSQVLSTMEEVHFNFLTTSIMDNSQIFLLKVNMTASFTS